MPVISHYIPREVRVPSLLRLKVPQCQHMTTTYQAYAQVQYSIPDNTFVRLEYLRRITLAHILNMVACLQLEK